MKNLWIVAVLGLVSFGGKKFIKQIKSKKKQKYYEQFTKDNIFFT
jgi:hypothetical protein